LEQRNDAGAAPTSVAAQIEANEAEIYKRLVEGVSDYAIFLLTADGHIATWNKGAQRLKGYAPDEAIGQHFSVFYPPDAIEAQWPQEELRRAQALGRFEDEGWRVRKDGSRFWANVVITPVRDANGTLAGYSKITRDLTERRRHEVSLIESERNLRLLIEGVADYAIFRLDPHGIVTSWNLGAQNIKGYRADEVMGKHFSIFYPQSALDAGWPEHELRVAAAEGRFEDEGWRVRKDGRQLWANVVITAIRDETGALIGFSKVTRDLTERRRAEQALKASEENLRLLVEGVKDHAIFLVDPHGAVASWNAGAERVLGYTSDEIVGRPESVLYTPADQAAGKVQAELLAATHAGAFDVDGWRAPARRESIWTNTKTTAVRGPGGEITGFIKIVRDLSEGMRIQQLVDEGRRINEFMAMLSHELRNPLAPIHNAAHILKASGAEPQILWCGELIERQINHLTRLVDDLLDVSRVTTGKIHIQTHPLELNTLVKLAAEAARSTIRARGHALAVNLAPQAIPLRGDGTRLTQVIGNLLANAAKYTPTSGHIDISVSRQRGVALLEITDTGVGMSKALIERAFDPFVQGERGLERAGGGLGIGLTLVKKIIDLHGGSIAISSAGDGKGTKVTVSLPLETAMPIEAPQGAVAIDAASKRVLIVDDNLDAADTLAEVLRMSGHDVQVAADGNEALKRVAEAAFDVVLLDIGLPGLNGHQVALQLRELHGTGTPRLMAVTGYGSAEDKAASKAAGFEAHLVKPVQPEEVLRLLA
jgi:PAS domain S-box-containing protein